MRLGLSMLCVVVTATAAWAGPYDGRYRPDNPGGDSWDCKTVGRDKGAVLLTSNIFFALGTRCTLRDPAAVTGLDATLYNAICQSDGAPWQSRIMIMRTDIGISVVQKGGHISPLRKCE
jgi:hypothetical protein